ncbi:unnamed protein product, partial [Effrenium voratum]
DGIYADSERQKSRRSRRVPTRSAEVCEDTDLAKRCERLRRQLASRDASGALGAVWALSRDPAGCRLVQSALEITEQRTAELLASELKSHVREAAASPHANYVLQKVIIQLHPKASAFIAEELLEQGARFARHRFGCRILCRLLEHCTTEEMTFRLIDEILADREEALDLCRHNFGHHVVQLVLERGDPRHKDILVEVLLKDLPSNAAHRRASYVVEAALGNCSPKDQLRMLEQLRQPAVLSELAQSRFGLFVARTLLRRPEVDAENLRKIPAVDELMKKTDAALVLERWP